MGGTVAQPKELPVATIFTARHDPQLTAHVTGKLAMVYEEGPSDEEDRPAYVRAASALSGFREYLAVIQDDANWLALVDAEQRVTAVPLPPSPSGARVFDKSHGNEDEKYDLEALITISSTDSHQLIGFASGSREGREWILRVRERAEATAAQSAAATLEAEFIQAEAFYKALRENISFCGAGLNIEGAVAVEGDRIMLFQRGNAEAAGDLHPVNATAEISWAALNRYLAAPDEVSPPELQNIRCYNLGELKEVRLTFSDAEVLDSGRILYSASAEDPDSDRIAGSVLGVIEANGEARWTELIDLEGGPFQGKIEGLSRDVRDPHKMHFVIDDDDADVPSEIFEATLAKAFFEPRAVPD